MIPAVVFHGFIVASQSVNQHTIGHQCRHLNKMGQAQFIIQPMNGLFRLFIFFLFASMNTLRYLRRNDAQSGIISRYHKNYFDL